MESVSELIQKNQMKKTIEKKDKTIKENKIE